MKRLAALLYGSLCYLVFLGAFVYAIGFVTNVGVPKSIDSGVSGGVWIPLGISLGLLALFGLQHGVMARPGFKQWWTRFVPDHVETISLTVFVFDPDNRGPVVSGVLADPNPAPVDTQIRLRAEIDDTGTGGSGIAGAQYSIDGGIAVAMSAADGAFDEPRESVVADIPGFVAAGVYEVCVTGTDLAGNTSAPDCTYVAVFDWDGGFVTGGRWIDVSAGGYGPDALLSGRANFGFVAKYRNAASTPLGSTEFQFHEGGLNFHSAGYDWLVVSASDNTALLTGTGTLNGALAPNGTPYRFMLAAHDSSPDTFGIRIWWESIAGETLVMDTGPMPLGGGSIVIHTRGD